MSLGLRDGITLDEHNLFLPEGSLLVMFTDGLTDCRNPNQEPFGLNRIKSILAGLNNCSAQDACNDLFSALMNYQDGSKQDDDVTLVAVHAK